MFHINCDSSPNIIETENQVKPWVNVWIVTYLSSIINFQELIIFYKSLVLNYAFYVEHSNN